MKEMLAVFFKVAVELRPGTPDLSTISVPCQRRVPEGLDNTFMVKSCPFTGHKIMDVNENHSKGHIDADILI